MDAQRRGRGDASALHTDIDAPRGHADPFRDKDADAGHNAHPLADGHGDTDANGNATWRVHARANALADGHCNADGDPDVGADTAAYCGSHDNADPSTEMRVH